MSENNGPSWDSMAQAVQPIQAGEAPVEKPNPAKMGRVTFRPMPGKIVVKVIGDNEKIGSGLLFAAATREIPRTTGRVMAVYEPFLVNNEETQSYLKPGDLVIFGMFTGTKVEIDRATVLVIKEHDILTIVEVDGDPDRVLENVEAER